MGTIDDSSQGILAFVIDRKCPFLCKHLERGMKSMYHGDNINDENHCSLCHTANIGGSTTFGRTNYLCLNVCIFDPRMLVN